MDTAYPRGGAGQRGAIRIPCPRLCAAVLLCLVSLVIYGCAPFVGHGSTRTPGAMPVPADRAILGGTEAAFTRQYGPPYVQDLYRFVTPNAGTVTIALGMRHIFSGQLTGQLRVQLIYLSSDKEWTPHEAEVVYQAFLPDDSVALGSTPQSGGTKRLYHSVSLAATLMQSGLLDTSGKDEPPGTFEVLCGRGIFVRGSDTYACLIQG